MWNTFANSKAPIKEGHLAFRHKNEPTDVLKEKVAQTAEKYKNATVSRRKAEQIICILQHAEPIIFAEDIFIIGIRHGALMQKFSEDRFSHKEISSFFAGSRDLRRAGALKATMDFGHVAPDWQYVLNRGIPGILADLETCGQKHQEDPLKSAYYRERIAVYTAIRDCFLRFADKAEDDCSAKGEFIARNLRHIAINPPETMAQAMQLILLFYVFQTELDTVTVRSLGGLDKMLYPFYKNDLASGRFSKDQLREITQYFLWEISCMQVTANMPFYIDGSASQEESRFTLFLLDAYRELNIYDPKIHVMYHETMNKTLLHRILEMIREGKNSFVFINTAVASRALEKIGISREDAKRVTVYGCYEPAAEGTEIPCTCGGMINMAKSIETVMSDSKDYATFDSFYEEVLQRLTEHTEACMDTIATCEGHYHEICPSMIMSPTYQSSRESGIDVYSGGAKYNNTSIVGAGLPTLVDGLIAVKKAVFENKIKTFEEFRHILLTNWQDNENLRLIIQKKYPKFGTQSEEADGITRDIVARFAACINGQKNGRGGVFRCGLFSVDWRFWMGEKTNATPDGRLAGEPLAKNLVSSIGQTAAGVTAYLNSLLTIDGTQIPDGYVADVALHASAVKGEAGLLAFEQLLATFMNGGGFSVHFNIMSPKDLIQAQKEPEKYQNLQVRVCGWNAHFVDINKFLQDEFIRQSSNGL